MARDRTGEADVMTGGAADGDRLQEAASGIVDQAARTAEAQASTTMTKAGDTLDQVAQAIREAGNGMREQQPQIAGFVDTAAQRVEDASGYLRQHDAGEVVDNVQRWARQQPAMVVGGGLAIGLLLGRFLKSGSSGSSGRSNGGQSGNGRYDGGSSLGYSSGLGAGASGYGSYETSAGGYAGGSGYASGPDGADPLGSMGAGSLGGVSTTSTLDETPGGYAADRTGDSDLSGLGAELGLDDNLADELRTTDDAVDADELTDTGATTTRSPKRRR